MANPPFQGDIAVLNTEFTFTLEIEAKLTVYNETSTSSPTSSNPINHSQSYIAFSITPFGNTIYTIVTSAIQTKKTEERVATTI